MEHARIFYFENGAAPEYLLASADWMPRNLDHRVEVAFPVLDARLQAQIRDVLEIQLIDTVKARVLLTDGRARRIPPSGAPPLRSQDRLYEPIASARSSSRIPASLRLGCRSEVVTSASLTPAEAG